MANPHKRKPRKQRKFTEEELAALDAEFRLYFTDLLTGWAACESNLRHILAELIWTDQEIADLIMYSILSTRGRVDLINRLAITRLGNKRRVRHLQKLLKEFKAVTELRNRLAHAVFEFKASGMAGEIGIVVQGTFVNFIKSNFDGNNAYEEIAIGRDLFNQMRQMTLRARSLAGRFLKFADSFRHSKGLNPLSAPPSQLWKLRKAKGLHPDPEKAKARKRLPRSSRL
jgi:hypothetical protein